MATIVERLFAYARHPRSLPPGSLYIPRTLVRRLCAGDRITGEPLVSLRQFYMSGFGCQALSGWFEQDCGWLGTVRPTKHSENGFENPIGQPIRA